VSWLTAAVLGLVQGLTEFLPISSSAHLRIVAALAGWSDPGAAFTAVTQLGTETAVLAYFRRDIATITATWARSLRTPSLRRDPRARLGWFVILGTLPIAILGVALQHPIETAFRDLRILAATLIVFGLILGLADRAAANTPSHSASPRPLPWFPASRAPAAPSPPACSWATGARTSPGTPSCWPSPPCSPPEVSS